MKEKELVDSDNILDINSPLGKIKRRDARAGIVARQRKHGQVSRPGLASDSGEMGKVIDMRRSRKDFLGINEDREGVQLIFNRAKGGERITDYNLDEYLEDLGLFREDVKKISEQGGEIADFGAGKFEAIKDIFDQLGIRVYGVEPNLDKLDQEEVNKIKNKIGLDYVIEARAEDLPFEDEKFKLILIHHGAFSYAFNELTLIKMVQEALRVLAPGGEIRISPIDANRDGRTFLIFEDNNISGQLAKQIYFNDLLDKLKLSDNVEVEINRNDVFDKKNGRLRTAGNIVIRKKKDE